MIIKYSSLFFVLNFISYILCEEDSDDVKKIKCLVCTRVVEEMQRNISSIDVNKVMEVGGFRIDDAGNYLTKSVPYTKSEIYLTELMEHVCTKMDDHVRANFKSTGELTVLPLTLDGKMNPEIDNVNVVQDADLNKKLKFYCENIVEEYDDSFIREFSKDQDDFISKICHESTQLCELPSEEEQISDEL